MPRVSAAHEQQVRDRIVRAAIGVFSDKGYHRSTIQDVVRASGLSVGAIYTHFSGKDELFLASCSLSMDRGFGELGDRLARSGDDRRAAGHRDRLLHRLGRHRGPTGARRGDLPRPGLGGGGPGLDRARDARPPAREDRCRRPDAPARGDRPRRAAGLARRRGRRPRLQRAPRRARPPADRGRRRRGAARTPSDGHSPCSTSCSARPGCPSDRARSRPPREPFSFVPGSATATDLAS